MTNEPRVALATTTVNVPRVLSLYRAHSQEVAFFVALDEKTPPEAREFCEHLGNCRSYTVEEQKALGCKCSEFLGWNTISRRNIATLEALKWGADIIVFVDDDNYPLNSSYFESFIGVLQYPFSGIRFEHAEGARWFDVGRLLNQQAPARGIVPDAPVGAQVSPYPAVDAKVGVAAGICLGDPDTNAWDRISRYPQVHEVSQLLQSGFVVDPQTWTVFNTQNTAVVRELAPAMLLCPQFGRYDDIFASLVCQRIMREHGYHVHFGQPFVWQQRNSHNLIRDLKDELYGAEYILKFAGVLDQIEFSTDNKLSVFQQVADLYQLLFSRGWGLKGLDKLAAAWIEDVESVL